MNRMITRTKTTQLSTHYNSSRGTERGKIEDVTAGPTVTSLRPRVVRHGSTGTPLLWTQREAAPRAADQVMVHAEEPGEGGGRRKGRGMGRVGWGK